MDIKKLYEGYLDEGLSPFMDVINKLSMGEKYAIFNNWLRQYERVRKIGK